jgi:hypothetical protein
MAKRKSAKRPSEPVELAAGLEMEILFEAVAGQSVHAARIDDRKLRLPAGVRHWFTARSIAGDLDVVLATEKLLKDLKNRAGVTLPNEGLIALDEETPLVRLVVTLIHELFHGALSAPGDDNLIARLFRCTPQQAVDREEEIVTYMAPRFADCLIRSGLLRLPPIPRRQRSRGRKAAER